MSCLFTVVICTRDEEKYIGGCLDSLLGGDYPLDQVQILVCDGNSRDRTRAIVEGYARQHRCITLLDNPGLTSPVGFNIGIRAARGDYAAILSAHATVASDWITCSVRALEEHPAAAGVGGRMITECEGCWGTVIAMALSSRFGVGNSSFRVGARPGWVDTVVFGAYRRGTFDQFGLFDEELARNQDDEFNHRIRARGGKLWFDPRIRTTYWGRSSLLQLYRQYAQYGHWKPLVLKKCGGVCGVRQFVPPLFVLALAASSLSGLFWRPAWLVLAVTVLCYTMVSSSVAVALSHRDMAMAVRLPVVFAILHGAYGAHFLLGALCTTLGVKPKSRHCRLTRSDV